MSIPKNEVELQLFIQQFESGDLAKNQWHHPQHVIVAFWYLSHFDEETAISKICYGIQNLNSKHQVTQTPSGGYHETWTIFFAKVLKRLMNENFRQTLSVMDQMNLAISFLNDFKGITLEYYSKELIMSWKARTSWVEPDLKSLV